MCAHILTHEYTHTTTNDDSDKYSLIGKENDSHGSHDGVSGGRGRQSSVGLRLA